MTSLGSQTTHVANVEVGERSDNTRMVTGVVWLIVALGVSLYLTHLVATEGAKPAYSSLRIHHAASGTTVMYAYIIDPPPRLVPISMLVQRRLVDAAEACGA